MAKQFRWDPSLHASSFDLYISHITVSCKDDEKLCLDCHDILCGVMPYAGCVVHSPSDVMPMFVLFLFTFSST